MNQKYESLSLGCRGPSAWIMPGIPAATISSPVNRKTPKKSRAMSLTASHGVMRSISRLIRYRHTSVSQTIVGSRISTNGRETIFQNSQSNRSAFMVGRVASRTEKSANKATLRYVARRVNANKGERQARLIHMGANITQITGLRHPTAKPLNNGGFYG